MNVVETYALMAADLREEARMVRAAGFSDWSDEVFAYAALVEDARDAEIADRKPFEPDRQPHCPDCARYMFRMVHG